MAALCIELFGSDFWVIVMDQWNAGGQSRAPIRKTTAGTPSLQTVLAGNDAAHPFAIAEEIARLLPHSEFITEWRYERSLSAATNRMKEFLTEHTPIAADR